MTDSQSSGDDEAAESTSKLAMSAFTDAMEKLNPVATSGGCYHNSSLITAVRDVAKGVGVEVYSYHYPETQSGKDICDRILCPTKSSIRAYCNERYDVLIAVDMRDALTQQSVKGTTAAVSIVDE